MNWLQHVFRISLLTLLAIMLGGCATQQARYYSSVVEYLYPNRDNQIEQPGIPVMKLPIKVGIAFVPDGSGQHQRGSFLGGSKTNLVLTEKQKLELMNEVSRHFRQYSFIGSIELIPSAYLRPHGSFTNLEQLSTMHGVDAMALLSYDQIQFTDEGAASLLYWTLIGAYTIRGEKNTTQTMLDAAVYDIKSRKMLFRAPGTSLVKGSATPVNLSEELRLDSENGFKIAAADLITQLDAQLQVFRDKVKQEPESYKVVQRSGSTGGGAMDGWFLALLGLLAGLMWFSKRPR